MLNQYDKEQKVCCLVIGGHVNGYSIIQDLYDRGVHRILLLDFIKPIASYSNKIKQFIQIPETSIALHEKLVQLNKKFAYIILFPTADNHIELLHTLHEKIKQFCFIPFNNDTIESYLNKSVQYDYCKKLGIPYPKTLVINYASDFNAIATLMFPVLIKPDKRDDITTNIFRNRLIKNADEFKKVTPELNTFLRKGHHFIASEMVPGSGDMVFAYVGYRNKNGEIINEWTGKKLSQYPNDFGVFASASNQSPAIIKEQGRRLLHGMNIFGIAEPEFKYDYRDQHYKLMEINFRSMMWHRVGNLSGINLQYTQYCDALGRKVEKQTQNQNQRIHYIFLNHEIENLFRRKGYCKIFKTNLFGGEKTFLAIHDWHDPKPLLINYIKIIKFIFFNFISFFFHAKNN
ncbi:MAG: hypothetical protein WC505_03165 [Patescibacteria group bacterium]